MWHFKILLGGLALTCMSQVWAASGYIYDLAGDVKMTVAGQEQAVRKRQEFDSGATINTGDRSHVVLKFEDGQVIALQSNTTFQIDKYRYSPRQPEQSSAFFSMLKGGLRFVTGLIGQQNKNAFKLTTPNATIGIRGTEAMAVIMNNTLYTQVATGGIGVSNGAGTAIFTAGQSAMTLSSVVLPTSVSLGSLPAGVFGQLGSISLPGTVATSIPSVTGGSSTGAVGGAAAAGSTGVVSAGVAVGAAAVGVGAAAAAGAAALGNSETTAHHGATTHH